MKKEITLEERKKIQLEMLIEIDAFCRAHNIKYMQEKIYMLKMV